MKRTFVRDVFLGSDIDFIYLKTRLVFLFLFFFPLQHEEALYSLKREGKKQERKKKKHVAFSSARDWGCVAEDGVNRSRCASDTVQSLSVFVFLSCYSLGT